MCNFGVNVSGTPTFSAGRMFLYRSPLHVVERPVHDLILGVDVAHNHGNTLVPAELLNGANTGAGVRQSGNGGVANCMGGDKR